MREEVLFVIIFVRIFARIYSEKKVTSSAFYFYSFALSRAVLSWNKVKNGVITYKKAIDCVCASRCLPCALGFASFNEKFLRDRKKKNGCVYSVIAK